MKGVLHLCSSREVAIHAGVWLSSDVAALGSPKFLYVCALYMINPLAPQVVLWFVVGAL